MPDDELTPAPEPRARRPASDARPTFTPAPKRYRALRTMICRDQKFSPGDELPGWVLEASPSLVTKRLGQDIEEVTP